ncbi:hypothetical protein Ssi03_26000 [Sphaerisporangium siamense]|uniref:Uncharacterized membrane protein HdeD (DUF308 family) n=1 Tax=Sphaerisporangium siamense TaxID=795645 RepID=A0A7W7G6Z5_9ACTN|nr:hypothetical protein [Sphaerisporangium siamense]MBB4700073.1 uncharacterized membrane protein HdeD (DUF308 family) [Sphaerisporangium siamense]GII84610.1 hypothetical protein Ssi03_26000 [Sphaerisporangium siamense]
MPLWPTLKHRVGRRGATLCVFAVLDLGYAGVLLTAPATGSYLFLAALLPLPFWAGIWAAIGVLCAVQAWMHADRIAFTAASLIKVVWGMVHLAGWALGVLPRGWVLAIFFLVFAALVAVIAGWPEGGER